MIRKVNLEVIQDFINEHNINATVSMHNGILQIEEENSESPKKRRIWIFTESDSVI